MADAILLVEKVCTSCARKLAIDKFGKQLRTKDGLRPSCKECRRIECSRWRGKNKEYPRAYYSKNKKKWLAYYKYTKKPASDAPKIKASRKPRIRKPDGRERKEYRKAYYLANRARCIAQGLRWAKENAGKAAAKAMHRLTLKRNATPSWANLELITEMYKEAARRSEETGKVWHVDHIVPLKSKVVCGLHVQDNLMLLPASENIAKSNRYWPDMP